MDFIITIDTEADNQWARPKTLTTENARFISRFQKLCERFDFPPTYLCTHEMVADPRFQDILGPFQEGGRAEIGAHLHPWSSPPFGPEEPVGMDHHTFPHELSVSTFRQKMLHLTDAIASAFSRTPTSYRAGRYGFCESHVDVLLDLGYRVDCSVAPYMSFAGVAGKPGGPGGVDYRLFRPTPFVLPGRSGEPSRALLEVPITILFSRAPVRSHDWLQRWLVARPRHPVTRVLRRAGYWPEWFRPTETARGSQLIRIYQAAQREGLPCAEMMFHSSELMPGCSPSFPDKSSIERLYRVFEATFSYVAAQGGRGRTLSDFAAEHLPRLLGANAFAVKGGGAR